MKLADIKEKSIASGERGLVACLFANQGRDGSQRGVLFVHGQASSQAGYEARARTVSRTLNAICLTFDLSGHGRDAANFERYSVYDHLQDVIAAYDYLAAIGAVDRERIGVCGASYGAYLAALLTAHRGIARLALRAPSLARDNDFPSMRETKSSKGKVPRGFDSVEVLRHYAGEVLILESEKDEIIPKSYISTYLGCCQRVSHQIIPGATHALTNPKWDEVFVSAITRWFERL